MEKTTAVICAIGIICFTTFCIAINLTYNRYDLAMIAAGYSQVQNVGGEGHHWERRK
jgi:hypothetical protein